MARAAEDGHQVEVPMQTRFVGPDRVLTECPTAEFIEDRIRNAGAEYWLFQSCTAVVVHDGSRNELALMVKPGEGVHVRFTPSSGADELALVDSLDVEFGEVCLHPGGNEMRVPRNQVVSTRLAMKAIRAFLETGDRPLTVDWAVVGSG